MKSADEELELERLAIADLEAEATKHWLTGHFGLALETKALLREARAHVAELERQLREGEH